MTSPVILVAGSMNFDISYVADDFPGPHSKKRALESWTSPGGAAANVAYLLARAGVGVKMVGCVGADAFGDKNIESLRSVGVDVSAVERTTRSATSICTIILAAGDKRMISSGGANSCLELGNLPETIGAEVSHIHVASGRPDIIDWAIDMARRNAMTFSLEWNGRDHRDLRQLPDLNFMNSDELSRLPGASADRLAFSKTLARGCAGWIVVTNGGDAAWATDGETVVEAAPQPIAIIDRTGGGDGFAAGFLSHWKIGRGIAECLDAGHRTAARVLEIRGTRPQ